MTLSSVLAQALNGLASASALFLVAAGLSLIFGVTRVVNFAHGSLFMVGMYVAVALAPLLGFWAAVPAAALLVAALGAAIEISVLRRIYAAPELLQLLATFAIVLLLKDAALWLWGPEDLLGPRAPGLAGAIEIAGSRFPAYDLFLIFVGPAVLLGLWLLLRRTRWGRLVRAASEDREMAGALGVNQKWLFTGVFALGSLLAGLGGALQIPRESATLSMDLAILSDAFVVVVVGGLGSIPGAFLAALLIGEIKAFCIGLGFSKATLVMEFLVMAGVLIVRPWGLLGRPPALPRGPGHAGARLAPPSRPVLIGLAALYAALLALPALGDRYAVVLMTEILVFAVFAASLHFLMGPAGLHSFGHAAYFGLGAYAAGLGALVFGWFCVRLSGVYAAMLTLAFAQIAWSAAYQWDALTGGSNGLVGVWPSDALKDKTAFYYLTLLTCAAAIALLWRALYAPFGYALRAGRDAPARAEACGIDVRAFQWAAFTVAGVAAGLGGALYAFSKGSLSPETLSIPRSVDGLVMVLLGGLQTLTGPLWGAALFTWLQDAAARSVEYWRAAIGMVILVLILVLPRGLGGLLPERR